MHDLQLAKHFLEEYESKFVFGKIVENEPGGIGGYVVPNIPAPIPFIPP